MAIVDTGGAIVLVVAVITAAHLLTGLWLELIRRLFRYWKQRHALVYLLNYSFPTEIRQQLRARYLHLTEGEADWAMHGLRVYFSICLRNDRQTAMPSRVVDAAWHEFLLLTHDYTEFSQRAFGDYFHHLPVARLASPLAAQTGLLNAWQRSCEDEAIDPANPQRLPLLFALDAELAIADGCVYLIEAGVFPRKPEGIPPFELWREIELALPLKASLADRESAAWEAATARLAAKGKRYLFDDAYCKARGRDALAPLFAAILERAALAVAVFGDIALARGRQAQVKQYPPPPQTEYGCGCSSSSG
jgi:hypothetical protein